MELNINAALEFQREYHGDIFMFITYAFLELFLDSFFMRVRQETPHEDTQKPVLHTWVALVETLVVNRDTFKRDSFQ